MRISTAALVLLLCFGFNMLGRGVADTYIVFLLPLSAEFGWSRGEVSSVYSIYLVVAGLVAPVVGLAFDRWGPRAVYATGAVCMGVGYFVAGGLTRLWQFQLFVGVLSGIGVCAMGMIPAASLIRRWFAGNMSTAMGMAYAGFGSGILLIVPLTQYLIQTHGWRDAYRALGSAFLVVVPLILLLPWRRLAAGARPAPARGAVPGDGAPRPSVLRGALRTRQYWAMVQVFFFTAMSMQTILLQSVAYLVHSGFAPLEAATAFGVAGFLSVIGVIAAGWLCDRVGHRATALATFALTFAGIGLLMLLSVHRAGWLLAAFVLIFGLAQGVRGPIVSSLAARHFPTGFATVYGTIFATMSLGLGTGAWLSGALYDWTGGYLASFAFAAASLAIATMPFWSARTFGPRRDPSS